MPATANREAVARALLAWVDGRHPRCSFGLVIDRDGARQLLATDGDKPAVFDALRTGGRQVALPL